MQIVNNSAKIVLLQGGSANVNEDMSPEKLVEKQRIVIEELK